MNQRQTSLFVVKRELSMADSGFTRGGVPTLGVQNCYFAYFFAENCMEMKKMD